LHQSNEAIRKSLHIAFGLGAFALRSVPWEAAAIVALGAVFGNWLLLHRIVGARVARHERGYDAGIVLYPVMVLLLILVFRNHLHFAALGWVILAFGDGVATLAGKAMPIGRIPWNREKSWGGFVGFLIAAGAGAYGVFLWFDAPADPRAFAIAVLAAAIIETLPLGIDDNVSVPVAAVVAGVITAFGPEPAYLSIATTWLIANTLLAAAGWFAKSVDLSGAISGWLLGAILIVYSGWPLYVTLLAFFIIGTACTKLGYKRKARLGLAEEKGGRRGYTHAFANVGVAALCALGFSCFAGAHYPIDEPIVLAVMGIAALATAAADTTASEIGQLYGKRTFLPLTFQRVEVGTEGAISVEGTLAGLVAGFAVSLVGAVSFSRFIGWDFIWPATGLGTLAALIGSYVESVIGSWNRKSEKPIPNGTLNFMNTAVGAMVVWTAWQMTL
jgi:uncharacterized protein (TIGR00297 family)